MSEKRETRLGMVLIGLTAALMAGAPVFAGTAKEVTITPNSVQTVPFALLDETAYVIVGYAQGCKILTGRVDIETELMDWEDAVGPGGLSVTFQGSPAGGFTGPADRLWMYAKLAGELSVVGVKPGPTPIYTIHTAKTALWIKPPFEALLDRVKVDHVDFRAEGGANPSGLLGGKATSPVLRDSGFKESGVSGDWLERWFVGADGLALLGQPVNLRVAFVPGGFYPSAVTTISTTIR